MARFADAKVTVSAVNNTGRAFSKITSDVGRMEKRFGRLGSFITKRFLPTFLAIKGVKIFGKLIDEFCLWGVAPHPTNF